MVSRIEFYIDVGSPATYLAWQRLPSIAQRVAAEIVYKPVLLGGVLKANASSAPTDVPAKAAWFRQDMERCARRHNIPFTWNPSFPINTMLLMRAATGLVGAADFHKLLRASFEGLWQNAINMADDALVDSQFRKHGLDPAVVRELAARPETKTALKNQTEEAVGRGVFGCPTMIVGDRLSFGQDRLVDVEEALNVSAAST
jgi:2-hydroxychromene-2-carboxylate isomerase